MEKNLSAELTEKLLLISTLSECLLDKLENEDDEEFVEKALSLAYLLNDKIGELSMIATKN